ncbi:MAG: Serine/threonine exchanger SteT [Turneriella sp.]|nr:Serine/threonine exchanger SteT [Turneriella sp.]
MSTLKRQLGFFTAAFTVIGSMVGSGVFLTSSELYFDSHLESTTILVLWILGGIVALSGALSYSELAAAYPEAGGEFAYLNRIFGKLPAFLTGFVSLTVGFSAPIAFTSLVIVDLTLRGYGQITHEAFNFNNFRYQLYAAFIPVILAAFHIARVKIGEGLQNFLTAIKTLLVFAIALALFFVTSSQSVATIHPTTGEVEIWKWGSLILSVMFAYSGWNAASYLGAEVKNPIKNLPRAMIIGTLVTCIVYVALNYNFLRFAGLNKETTSLAVNAFTALLGSMGGAVLSFLIAFFLVSSVSAEVMIGPRVYYAMAEQGLLFKKLAQVQPRLGTPAFAILLQSGLSVLYILFFGFGGTLKLLIFMGFALSFFPFLTVFGLLYAHYFKRNAIIANRPYRSPLFPLFPLLYLTAAGFMMIASLIYKTKESLWAICVVLLGALSFYVWQAWEKSKKLRS